MPDRPFPPPCRPGSAPSGVSGPWPCRRGGLTWPGLAWAALGACLVVLAAGCTPTKGSASNVFVPEVTTNTDFEQTFIPVGVRPTSAAIAPRSACPGANNLAPNVAVANLFDNTLTYLTNDGTGNFSAMTLATGIAPTQVQFADLDRSGNCTADLVVMQTSNTGPGYGISVLLTTDNNQWALSTYGLPATPDQMAVIDMNGDGYPDIVATVSPTSEIALLLNNGASPGPPGTFAQPMLFGLANPPTRFVVADNQGVPLDFDGDACPDLAVLVPALNQVQVLTTNNGTPCAPYAGGSFAVAPYSVDPFPFDIAAADLDGNGKPELITTSLSGPVMGVLGNSGTIPAVFYAFPGTPLPQRRAPQHMALARFGGGSIPQIAISHPDDATISVNSLLRDGTFLSQMYTLRDIPFDVVAGDFGGNRVPGIVVPELRRRMVYFGYWVYVDGVGGFTFTQIGFENAPGTPVMGRLRPGTAQDIVIPQQTNNKVVILRNKNP